MAANDNVDQNRKEESSPLLKANDDEKSHPANDAAARDGKNVGAGSEERGYEWTANGLPLGHGSVVGEPVMGRNRWDSSLFACLGRNDEFCSSDLEVCVLGSVAPCVLYGSNVERLTSTPGTFPSHCLPYSGLYLIGNSFFGGNCLAPWFSYPSRTAIRRRFNLEGSCEALHRSCGCCCKSVDEAHIEQCETACDLATHIFCHPCALCQEGRELRRRVPHPGFNTQQILVMVPPMEQTMGRGV